MQIGAKFACRRIRSDYHQATWDSMLAACRQESGAEEADARQLEMAAATKALHFSIGQEVCCFRALLVECFVAKKGYDTQMAVSRTNSIQFCLDLECCDVHVMFCVRNAMLALHECALQLTWVKMGAT